MKKILMLTVIVLISFNTRSQDSNFSMELSYPMLLDNYFIGDNYNGIIDLGLDYVFESSKTINFGLSFNTSVLQNNANQNVSNPFKVVSYVLQPRVVAVGNSAVLGGFSPFAGLGYSFFVFDISGSSNGFTDASGDTQSGINLNFGMGYDLSQRFFAQIQYDFMRTSVADGVPNVKYNTNVNLLKIGVGYKF